MKTLVRALLGVFFFVAVGAGLRVFFAHVPWERTSTYTATAVSSTVPDAVIPASDATSSESADTATSVPPVALPAPTISLSSASIEQSDTFVVSITDLPENTPASLSWYERTFDFVREGDTALGFLGADAKQAPGSYPLAVRIGTSTVTRSVTVAKRAFPVTVLTTTPELEAEGHTPTAIQTNVANENQELNAVLIYRPEAYFSKPFVEPLDRIVVVGAYGNVRKNGDVSLQHLGADLDAAEGTPVHAINDGVVRLAKSFTDYGNTIVVDHGLGIFSYYLHLSVFDVKVGDRVTRGQVIAKSGNTGYSIGPHLHFSVRIRNTSVDPLRFIETANRALGHR